MRKMNRDEFRNRLEGLMSDDGKFNIDEVLKLSKDIEDLMEESALAGSRPLGVVKIELHHNAKGVAAQVKFDELHGLSLIRVGLNKERDQKLEEELDKTLTEVSQVVTEKLAETILKYGVHKVDISRYADIIGELDI